MNDKMKVNKVKKTKTVNARLMRLAKYTGPTYSDPLPDKDAGKGEEETTIKRLRDDVVLTITADDKELMDCGFVLDRRFGWIVGLPHYIQHRTFRMDDLPVWDIEHQRWICPNAIVGMTSGQGVRWTFATGLGGICDTYPWDDEIANAGGRKS